MAFTEVHEYRKPDGDAPFTKWLDRLRDATARTRILARVDRLRSGLRGDWKAVGAGVFELRVDFGPGYRIYCAQDGPTVVLLLCAGDKRTQVRDIEVAHGYWQDYQTRTGKRGISGGRPPA